VTEGSHEMFLVVTITILYDTQFNLRLYIKLLREIVTAVYL